MKLQSRPGAQDLHCGSSPGHLQEGGCWGPVSTDSRNNWSPSQEEKDKLQSKENILKYSHSKDRHWQIGIAGKTYHISPKIIVQILPVKCHQRALIHRAVTLSQLCHSRVTKTEWTTKNWLHNYTANLSTTEQLKFLAGTPNVQIGKGLQGCRFFSQIIPH